MKQLNWYQIFGAEDIPDGKTVLPTDDVQILLKCAGITNKSYTTLIELFADTTTLLAVINSNNAIDYLVRSTTWASSVTSNSTAMSYIGLNNYASNTLLADSTWCSAICNSTYFESVLNVKVPTMTSNTTPSGECFGSTAFNTDFYKAFDNDTSDGWLPNSGAINNYVGYTFANAVDIFKVDLQYVVQGTTPARTLTIQHGNSNTDIDTLSIPADSGTSALKNVSKVFNSKVNDSKFRLLTADTLYVGGSWYIRVAVLQFYGRADV